MKTNQHDLAQTMVQLDRYHHWTLSVVKRKGSRKAYTCSIWDEGKRVNAQGPTPADAAERCMAKLRQALAPKLKVVR